MCLAVPGEILDIVETDLRSGRVSFAGVVKTICLAYVPDARVGDYVLAHAGFAIAQIDERHAQEALEAIGRLGSP